MKVSEIWGVLIMKKSLYFAFFCVFAFFTSVLAVSLCSRNEVVTVVLDPSINGVSSSANEDAGVWQTVFPYGVVSGIAACLPYTATSSGDYADIEANGGENTGGRCWCKMKHPMESKWVFMGTTEYSGCNNCVKACGNAARNNRNSVRYGLFGSVAQ